MIPPNKDQTDIGFDNPTIDASNGAIVIQDPTGTETENKDETRQEYAKDADINYMLSRFGLVPARGTPTYGEWDDSMDLQQALTSVSEAKSAYNDLPKALKEKFANIEELLTAYNNGSLVIKDGEVPIPPKTEAQLLQERIDELEKRILEKRIPPA